jgi:hypothetical protein
VNNTNILQAWAQSEGQEAITAVAGTPIVDETLLRQVNGGGWFPSSGWICTLSAECNGGAGRCNIF